MSYGVYGEYGKCFWDVLYIRLFPLLVSQLFDLHEAVSEYSNSILSHVEIRVGATNMTIPFLTHH
jgi:hypothetical protein